MTTEQKLPAPPYVGFRTFTNFLDWLGEVGIPTRIDRSFWGDKFSGAIGNQIMATLRFFGLTDEKGTPDPTLETMAKDVGKRKITLNALMDRYSAALGGLDLERATAGEMDERFRRYDISGDTFRKAVVFFIQAAQYCDMPLSPYITKRKRPARTNGIPQPRGRGRPPKVKPPATGTVTVQPKATADIDTLGLHPTLSPLLRDLNLIGSKWNKAERDRWVDTFLAVMDYAYPTTGAKEKEAQ